MPVNFLGTRKVRITVVSADGLEKRDIFRLPDPCAVITVDSEQTHRTSVIKGTLNPYWEEQFDVFVKDSSVVAVEIFDQRKFKRRDRGSLGIVNIPVANYLDLVVGGRKVQLGLKRSNGNLAPVRGKLMIHLSSDLTPAANSRPPGSSLAPTVYPSNDSSLSVNSALGFNATDDQYGSLATSSCSSFHSIINNALKAYEKRTRNNLLFHPLAEQIQTCNSPGAILHVLQQQIEEVNQSQSGDETLTKWLDPTVKVLYAFNEALGEGVGLVFSPAKAIFVGVGVLLSTVRDGQASRSTMIDIFERMECFFLRLETYIEVQPTTEMRDIIIKIMVEVLSILAIVTKEINRHPMRKYLSRLIGRADVRDALARLDNLTQEEARMATTQVLKATRIIDDRVRGVDDRVAHVDGRILAIDGKVTQIIDGGNKAEVTLQKTADDIDQAKRSQLRENIRKWLSPPDPSTNHNLACATHHKGTTTWFLQDSTFQIWKSSSPLLWIYGKPGSGKSVLCSTIIQDIKVMQEAGRASMGYFYFDFRDASKQHRRDLLTSLLFQLSAHSSSHCGILSLLHAAHDDGARQPTDQELTKCLKKMLRDQRPIYLIIDALDESPDASGIPSPREEVLQLITELVGLSSTDLQHLHICVTSRQQVDIRIALRHLTTFRVGIDDRGGQRNDIVDYVTSVVYSNAEPIMRGWEKEVKDLVIETLCKRADGMFRWAFCQLEILRHCLPWAVRRTLKELPESLEETYARILKEIKPPNRDYACRLLQCLVAAIRPLLIEELAEVLAIDFDDEGGVPKLNPRWRWEDQEQALLSSCSSLITIVNVGESRFVQFSHSSVKEYLTSDRLATRSEDVSRYHILLEPAHTILAQACVSVLLQLDDRVVKDGIYNRSPLASYAARHWVFHAQFGDVSSHIKGTAYLFDKDKPHFRSWLRLYDIDTKPDASSIFPMFISFDEPEPSPLYYAALCGFHDVAKQIISEFEYSEDVDARGGYYVTPLVAALAGRHFNIAQLLRNHGADPNVRCYDGRTPLHAAVQSGNLEMVQKLIEYNADVNAQNRIGWTPLHIASRLVQPNIDVVYSLLVQGVDVNAQAKDGSTALHEASAYGTPEVVRILLIYDAKADLKDKNGRTPHRTVSGTRGDRLRKLGLLKTCTVNLNTAQGITAEGSSTTLSRPTATLNRLTATLNRDHPTATLSRPTATLNRPTTTPSRPTTTPSRPTTTPSRPTTLKHLTTTQHGQRSSRQIMYLRHVSSSSILDRSGSDQSDADPGSDISQPSSNNSG